ncbi:MAG: abortive infection protein [Hyphococcus sp.]|nr:MAG: abortive infection protein [Marinicaulis sp.]
MTRRIFGAITLFLLAMLGAAAAIVDADIPAAIIEETGLSDQALRLISLLNNGLFIGVAVLIGAVTAHRVGLTSLIAHKANSAPALLTAFPVYAVLGVIMGAAVTAADQWAFANIDALRLLAETSAQQFDDTAPSLAVRFLYGGITEEVLLRWGLLSLVAWAIWAITKNRVLALFVAIPVAAFLFGAGHLPALYTTLETVPVEMIVRVIILNAALGIVYGIVYARNSLEAAMVTHAATHVGMLSAASYLS